MVRLFCFMKWRRRGYMKVAFSASFWMFPEVHKLLESCDVVYTTNIDRFQEISKTFDWCTNVQPLAHGLSGLVNYIKSTYPADTEFVEFCDLHKIMKDNYVHNGQTYIRKDTKALMETVEVLLEH